MTNTNMEIGKQYDIAYALTSDGKLEKAKMTLKEIHYHERKEVYIFEDNSGPIPGPFITYDHKGEIDWEFMEELDFIFN